MAPQQYGQYQQQQSRPYHSQGHMPRGVTKGGPPPREQAPYANPNQGYEQHRQRPNGRVESYIGYDGGILDSYGAENGSYNAGGYDQQYQQGSYGQAGYGDYSGQQDRPPPQPYREPRPQRRDDYGPPQGNRMNMQDGGRSRSRPPPSRDYPPPQNGYSQQGGYAQPDYPIHQDYRPHQNYGPTYQDFGSQGGPQGYDQRRQQQQQPPPPPPPPHDDRQQYSRPQGASPSHQKLARERLLQPTSPKSMPFDNPFPVFPANQQVKPKDGMTDVEHAMAGMEMNGRPSFDGQRPPTSHSQHSQHSGKQNMSRQRMDQRPEMPQSRPSGDGYNQRPSLDYGAPLQRAMTMPQDIGNPNFRGAGPNQNQSRFQDPGYDLGAHPRDLQDPGAQQYFAASRDRPGMMQGPPRPSTATGSRQPMPIPMNSNIDRRAQPNNVGPARPGTSHGYRDGPISMPGGQQSMSRDPHLEAYMPDFNSQPGQRPMQQGPMRAELDATPPTGITPINAQSSQSYPDFRGAKSQPDLRGQAHAYSYNEPVTKMPPYDAGVLSGQARSPLRPLVTDPLQMPRQNYSQSSDMNSPRQFHRPGAPPLDRQGTAESGRSDPGPGPARGAPNGGQSSSQSARSTNPDALPTHPAPVRPGLAAARPGAALIRQGQAQRMSGSPNGSFDPSSEGPITMQELALLREAAKAKPSDQAQQLQLAKKLVEAAQVLANDGGRADAKTTQKNRENYIFEAHKMVKKLVNANYHDAMFYLADCYGTGGLGLNPDPKEAFVLYQSAAKLGHGPSAYRTAVCCEMGQSNGGGTREDPLKAVQWYRRATALGDVPAMYKLGMIMLKGHLGQPVNLGEALMWLQRAAEKSDIDNPHALHELGGLYESAPPGGKIIRDERHAVDLYTQAAKLGYRTSQCRLAKAYEYGQLGLPIDNRTSIHWYSKAAAQEDHDAELALSGWYLTGSPGILEQNDQEAYLWARKAALAEHPKAEFAMGYFSETGIGCPKSFEDAKRWYGRAAAHRYPKARERLEELTRGGTKGMKAKERISRSDPKKHEDCVIM